MPVDVVAADPVPDQHWSDVIGLEPEGGPAIRAGE
jgi:hypothetical protein